MKTNLLLITLLIGRCWVLEAQKPALDSSAIVNWPEVNGEKLSNDGKYALFLVDTLSGIMSGVGGTLNICSTDGTWREVFFGVSEADFSQDSRLVVVETKSDSLVIVDLGGNKDHYFDRVRAFELSKGGGAGVLAMETVDQSLVVLNLKNWKIDTLGKAEKLGFDNSGRWLFWSRKETDGLEKLELFDCLNNRRHLVWEGASLGSIVFEGSSGRLAFLAKKVGGTEGYSIWDYMQGADSSRIWLESSFDQRGNFVEIRNGRLEYLPELGAAVFRVKQKSEAPEGISVVSKLKIWRYNDAYGSPIGMINERPNPKREFLAIGYNDEKKIVTLGMEGDGLAEPRLNPNPNLPFALVLSATNRKEGYRKAEQRPDIFLVNLRNGSRKCIKSGLADSRPSFSPGGKYVSWYDPIERNYFSYDIASGELVNVSKAVGRPLYDEDWDFGSEPPCYGETRWLKGDIGMLVYDRYDIWRLDPTGHLPAINITNGYGRRHKIRVRLVFYNGSFGQVPPPIDTNDSLAAAGFDERTKENGFLKISLGRIADPVVKIMSADMYYFPENVEQTSFPFLVLKACMADVFLVRRMRADKFPNIYATKDFQHYSELTTLAPERSYNWLTSELIHWTTFRGRKGEAILYKPADFNPTKKYAVIFYCYQRLTPGLNEYIDPDYSMGPINIPWFVSRDYIVVCPDIRYEVGDPGRGIYDYMVSAVNYIKTKPWVNARCVGLEGHSWGGFEVNYLLTRTDVFACAVSAAGGSNLSSLYGLEGLSFCTGPAFVEMASYRMGGALSDSARRYIENSPVFEANRVRTPLLLMNNDKDLNVPWEQGVEFFTSLRRLGKRAWLLEYPESAHSVYGLDGQDFTERITDFFDCYLKRKAMPHWMEH